MTYILLLFEILAFVIIAYASSKGDILSPSFILCFFYLVSEVCSILGLRSWNTVSELNGMIFAIYFVGLIAFISGDYFGRNVKINTKFKLKFVRFLNCKDEEELKVKDDIITVSDKIVKIFSLSVIVAMIFLYRDLRRMCINSGFVSNSISKMLNYYRVNSNLFKSGDGSLKFSFISNQFIKWNNVTFLMFSYIFINNFVKKFDKDRDIKYLIPCILAILCSFFTSGRSALIKLFVYSLMIFLYKLLKSEFNGEVNKEFRDKIYKIIIRAGLIIVPTFYLLLPLYGRSTSANFIDYCTFYVGCPVPSLSIYLRDNPKLISKRLIDKESLLGIFNTLSKMKIIKYNKSSYSEFIWELGMGSNVYTSFRGQYADFGLLGLLVGHFLFGFVFAKMYTNYKKGKSVFFVMFYSFYASYIIDAMRADAFFAMFLSLNTIIYMVLIKIISDKLIKCKPNKV